MCGGGEGVLGTSGEACENAACHAVFNASCARSSFFNINMKFSLKKS